MDLVPWTSPPRVFIYGPGLNTYGGDADLFAFTPHAKLTKIAGGHNTIDDSESDTHSNADSVERLVQWINLEEDDDKTKVNVEDEDEDEDDTSRVLRVLNEIAVVMFHRGEASPGDFIVVATAARNNCSLMGVVIGANGVPVNTSAVFTRLYTEYVADRMVIPAHLVSPSQDPATLFANLFSHVNINAPVVVCLPSNSALIQALNCNIQSNYTFVMSAFEAYCYSGVAQLRCKAMNDIVQNGSFMCVSKVPSVKINDKKGWECDWTDFALGGNLVAVSKDGKTWVGKKGVVDNVIYDA